MRIFKKRKTTKHTMLVEHLDGSVERDGAIYPDLETALPRGWEAWELGDALYCQPTIANEARIARAARRAEKRSRPGHEARTEFVPAVVKYPTELVAYDPRKFRVVDKDEEPGVVTTGGSPVGCYGSRYVVPA